MSVTPPRLPAHRPPVRVVLADDAYLVRAAVRHLLEGAPTIVVVGESEDATGVPRICDEQRADLLITDIRMPPTGEDEGIRLARRLRETHPALGVIVLSTYADVTYALKLFESGSDSRGYLLKDRIRDRAQLVDAVVAVANGHSAKAARPLGSARCSERSIDVSLAAPRCLRRGSPRRSK